MPQHMRERKARYTCTDTRGRLGLTMLMQRCSACSLVGSSSTYAKPRQAPGVPVVHPGLLRASSQLDTVPNCSKRPVTISGVVSSCSPPTYRRTMTAAGGCHKCA